MPKNRRSRADSNGAPPLSDAAEKVAANAVRRVRHHRHRRAYAGASAAEARRLIAEHGLLIADRFGALHSNPAAAIARDAETSYRGSVRARETHRSTDEVAMPTKRQRVTRTPRLTVSARARELFRAGAWLDLHRELRLPP